MLRRLVDQARKAGAAKEDARQALDAAYRLMAALAGDRSGFEDAARALYAADFTRVLSIASAWPADVADYVANRVRHAAELTNRVDLNQ